MIRDALITWRKATEGLLLETEKVAEETRDEAIKGIESLLNVRDVLQPEILAPFTPEEELYGKELVVLETDLQEKMILFNNQIRIDITGTQSKKGHVKSYVNPYSNVARDGTFYDTKQ